MYMRMVTEPRGALVGPPVGLRRPYAHTSDTRSYYEAQSEQFPINNYRYSLPPQRPGASTLSITWSLCSGGFGPATYRSIEAPATFQKVRGEGYVHPSTNPPTRPRTAVHARDTWQQADRYRKSPIRTPSENPSTGRAWSRAAYTLCARAVEP